MGVEERGRWVGWIYEERKVMGGREEWLACLEEVSPCGVEFERKGRRKSN
jgi:hypothetical protein